MTEVDWEFIEPWSNDKCVIRVGSQTYRITRLNLPPRRWYWRAFQNGVEVAIRARFSALIKYLAKIDYN